MEAATRLRDGLFLGDASAAQDSIFITHSRIKGIVNCAAGQVHCHFEHLPISYLKFNFADNECQTILDKQGSNLAKFCTFVNKVLDDGDGVLVHSLRGQSRSVTILAAYLMMRYSWSSTKVLDYISQRRPSVCLKPSFHRQLVVFEMQHLPQITREKLSSSWYSPRTKGSDDNVTSAREEAYVVQNTFLNSRTGPVDAGARKIESVPDTERRTKISWNDEPNAEQRGQTRSFTQDSTRGILRGKLHKESFSCDTALHPCHSGSLESNERVAVLETREANKSSPNRKQQRAVEGTFLRGPGRQPSPICAQALSMITRNIKSSGLDGAGSSNRSVKLQFGHRPATPLHSRSLSLSAHANVDHKLPLQLVVSGKGARNMQNQGTFSAGLPKLRILPRSVYINDEYVYS